MILERKIRRDPPTGHVTRNVLNILRLETGRDIKFAKCSSVCEFPRKEDRDAREVGSRSLGDERDKSHANMCRQQRGKRGVKGRDVITSEDAPRLFTLRSRSGVSNVPLVSAPETSPFIPASASRRTKIVRAARFIAQ